MKTFTKNRGGSGGSSRESHLPREGYLCAANVYPQDELRGVRKDALFAVSKSHQELSRDNKVGAAHFGGHSLGIYIQVPFCQTKCTYCNFHTGVASPSAYSPYARAVEREITNWRALHQAAGLPSADAPAPDCHPEPGRILDGGEGSAFSDVLRSKLSAGTRKIELQTEAACEMQRRCVAPNVSPSRRHLVAQVAPALSAGET